MASNATWAEWFQSEGEKLKERALVDSEKLKERAKEAISKAKEDNKELIEALQKAKEEAATTLQDGLGDDNLEVVNQVRARAARRSRARGEKRARRGLAVSPDSRAPRRCSASSASIRAHSGARPAGTGVGRSTSRNTARRETASMIQSSRDGAPRDPVDDTVQP